MKMVQMHCYSKKLSACLSFCFFPDFSASTQDLQIYSTNNLIFWTAVFTTGLSHILAHTASLTPSLLQNHTNKPLNKHYRGSLFSFLKQMKWSCTQPFSPSMPVNTSRWHKRIRKHFCLTGSYTRAHTNKYTTYTCGFLLVVMLPIKFRELLIINMIHCLPWFHRHSENRHHTHDQTEICLCHRSGKDQLVCAHALTF